MVRLLIKKSLLHHLVEIHIKKDVNGHHRRALCDQSIGAIFNVFKVNNFGTFNE